MKKSILPDGCLYQKPSHPVILSEQHTSLFQYHPDGTLQRWNLVNKSYLLKFRTINKHFPSYYCTIVVTAGTIDFAISGYLQWHWKARILVKQLIHYRNNESIWIFPLFSPVCLSFTAILVKQNNQPTPKIPSEQCPFEIQNLPMQTQRPLTSVKVLATAGVGCLGIPTVWLQSIKIPTTLSNPSAVCLKRARFTSGVPKTLSNTTGLHQPLPWYSSENLHIPITGSPLSSISASQTKHSCPPSSGTQAARAGTELLHLTGIHSSANLIRVIRSDYKLKATSDVPM